MAGSAGLVAQGVIFVPVAWRAPALPVTLDGFRSRVRQARFGNSDEG